MLHNTSFNRYEGEGAIMVLNREKISIAPCVFKNFLQFCWNPRSEFIGILFISCVGASL